MSCEQLSVLPLLGPATARCVTAPIVGAINMQHLDVAVALAGLHLADEENARPEDPYPTRDAEGF